MDTGKILIGFAFVLLSVALVVTPSHAEMQDLHCDAGGFADIMDQPDTSLPAQNSLSAPAETGSDPVDPTNHTNLP
jgi:hypothetical protein